MVQLCAEASAVFVANGVTGVQVVEGQNDQRKVAMVSDIDWRMTILDIKVSGRASCVVRSGS